MEPKSLRLIVAVTFFLLSASSAIGGPAKLMPEKPRWKETVAVTYDPAAEGAKFLPGDSVIVLYDLKFPGSSKSGWAKMEAKDGAFRCGIEIPERASFIYLSFITMDGEDAKAFLRSMVFRPDGVPAEGAWQWKIAADYSASGYQEAFENERKLYPENYAVFRNKWLMDGAFKKDEQKAIIGREMAAIINAGIKDSPGWLWSLSSGHLLLGDEKACLEVLRRMVRLFPDSEDTAWALREYDSQAFAQQFRGEGPAEVGRLKTDLLRRNPRSKIFRDYLLLWMAYEKDPPLELVRAGCEAWIKDERENPTPYYTLAMVLLKKNENLPETSALVAKALDRLVAGKLRLFGDTTGSLTERTLPDDFATAAAIHEKLGDSSAALAEIKAAQTLAKEENRPDLLLREASIWRSLGYFENAEKPLLEALRRGADSAEDELRALYRQRHQTEEGFAAWLADKTKKPAPAAAGDKKIAPAFEVKTLGGETLSPAGLAGKAVVLNFWYVGCAPCQVEMPGLNKLVEEFKDEEVVFIGFALDEEGRLREFLKKNPFHYKIVAGSSSIAAQYGISAYPTHILINKQGQVEFFLTGGDPDRHEQLRPLIRNLLK